MTEQRDQTVLPSPIRIPLLNLWLERKADLLTFVAFVLASLSVFSQAFFFFQGVRVSLAPPEQVLLNFEQIRGENYPRRQLRLAARMAYVNSGREGYNAVLRRESVSFVMNGIKRIQYWHSEQQFTDLDNNGELEPKYVDTARPRPINAGSSLSREIYFASFPVRCHNDQNCDVNQNFVLETDALPWIFKQQSITLSFRFELFGFEPSDPVRCTIDVDKRVKFELVHFGWTAPPCWPIQIRRPILPYFFKDFPSLGDVP